MVGILFEFKDLKWIIRICLILLFVGGLTAEFYGYNFFRYLVVDHKSTTLILVFLTGIMFFPWFVPKPKRLNNSGGEVPMNKFYAVIIFVVTVLVSLLFALTFYTDDAKAWLGGLGGGIGQTVVDMSVGFNQSLATFEPYQVLVGGSIGGIVLTVFFANWLWPRIQQRRQIVAPPPIMQDRMTPSLPTPVQKPKEPAA